MDDPDRIEGRNPVREALRAGRPIRRILIADGVADRGALGEIVATAASAGVRVERVPRPVLDKIATGRAHQGVIAEAEPYRYRSWEDAVAAAKERGEVPLLLALDGVTDPGNLGSLIRSAEAAGAHAVLVPKRRAAPVTPTVEKASAGALEHLPVDRVTNLERALEACKGLGLWVVGLSGSVQAPLWACDLLTEPLVLIVGAEGKGLSRLISERADALVRIPMQGRVGSLNAAVAGAVALFEVSRRRSGDDD
ncbi:MAG TPA: 23S rRNA (guanosine(2251)-2'-O)-methyltransferase RlmB [Actinomycetota bacterium]|nr:23S rRNA (guanosine(2251)-2'-O)-methyltransferase RlmB [Actinomycetota bacterium]